MTLTHRTTFPIAALLCLALGSAADAQTKDKLASSGAWTLYSGNFMFIMEEGFMGLDPSCFAEESDGKTIVDFAMLPASMNADKGKFAGVVYLQASAEAWNFRKHYADVNIGDGHFNLHIGGAFYDENFVMVNLGGHGKPPAQFAQAAQNWSGTITISDEKKHALASFPANGFGSIYAQMLKCGGM